LTDGVYEMMNSAAYIHFASKAKNGGFDADEARARWEAEYSKKGAVIDTLGPNQKLARRVAIKVKDYSRKSVCTTLLLPHLRLNNRCIGMRRKDVGGHGEQSGARDTARSVFSLFLDRMSSPFVTYKSAPGSTTWAAH
jgi:hypothetical protein